MNDDILKNWVPPENPDDWDIVDKVRAEKLGLGHLIPGSYEFRIAYFGLKGTWPKTKLLSPEERLRHTEEMQGRVNKNVADEEWEKQRQERYKNKLINSAKKSFKRK